MSDGGREKLLAIEDTVNDLLDAIDGYEKEMRQILEQREQGEPLHKVATLQIKRVGWIQDLVGQTEEIVRDMLDRTENYVSAEQDRFV